MGQHDPRKTVGQYPKTTASTPLVPVLLTRLVWLLWLASAAALAARLWTGASWTPSDLLVVDGLTLLLWTVVTFISGIVHSYSRRYMAGSRDITRFFTRTFAFTLSVALLVAADHVILFAAAWTAMGLLMADLIGYVREWPQARAAGKSARRYFLGSSTLLTAALLTLWSATGATRVSELSAAVETLDAATVLLVSGALLLAAMIQSALVPFHGWLLSSMTAPTPASALMHAGFVNAGGILLVRFAPVVTAEVWFLSLVVVVAATSALLGKLMKSVEPAVKRQLGCSTVGQMGFMILQVGLGFFGAAIAHLILHGFYKGYQFLSSGDSVEHTSPTPASDSAGWSGLGAAVAVATALGGGALFAFLTGEAATSGGQVLVLLVVLTTLHATQNVVRRTSLPALLRYVAVPLTFFPAILIYAGVYGLVKELLRTAPAMEATVAMTPLHVAVAVAFLLAYVGVETGVLQRSDRLYVELTNAMRLPAATVVSPAEVSDE
ncbi:proton-conducting transporter transmembrane domain-containing protein [Halogeometricum limi]|uniref:NAD(P)H-quinone oxidoreductase subunit 5 n=1 Tax=Halogeometricum limi TaxID=555875 RepID=A0A1I6GT54_9EURY|nr:proton-conducting transporter membrane subunit [Halogeometricum limi]SFR45414.1 NAD(P)H-quinone oxidoreductase subunit 5 [Halogeometricum limi]